MLLNINVKNCQTCHLLSKGFCFNCASLVGNHVMGYIFSDPINSSSIISIDYNIRRSSNKALIEGLLKDPNLLLKVG